MLCFNVYFVRTVELFSQSVTSFWGILYSSWVLVLIIGVEPTLISGVYSRFPLLLSTPFFLFLVYGRDKVCSF